MDLADLDRALEGLIADGAGVMAQVSPVIAEGLVTAVVDEFETEGRGRWQPLAQSTIRKRRQRQPTGSIPMLIDTTNLVGSITAYSNARLAEAFTNVPYSGYHTSKRPRRVLPLRDFTDIDLEDAQDEAAELILAFVMRRTA